MSLERQDVAKQRLLNPSPFKYYQFSFLFFSERLEKINGNNTLSFFFFSVVSSVLINIIISEYVRGYYFLNTI